LLLALKTPVVRMGVMTLMGHSPTAASRGSRAAT
jgi:hypothetical protein